VHDPTIAEKIEILHLMESLGIDTVNIGLPGAGPRAYADTEALAREIVNTRMKIRPNCAARTHKNDIKPIIEISERVGMPIEAATFIGSSPIRRLVEDWTVDHLQRTTEEAVKFAAAAGLPVMYVTEDTMRTDPSTVITLYSTAIRSGARAIVLCDTVGHATPRGAFNLVKFAIEEVVKPSGEKIRVDWHGHNDRGLAIANSLAAIAAGADQVHAAALALGERVGNTPMELMLVNLRLLGLIDRDLSTLKKYSRAVAKATHTEIPPNYPVVGRDAFRTATGVHAAAIVKAYKTFASLRPRASDRSWPAQRPFQRDILAGKTRRPRDGRIGRSHFQRRQTVRARPHRRRNPRLAWFLHLARQLNQARSDQCDLSKAGTTVLLASFSGC
ncbi:MAG: hypothetical protein ABSF68_06140, partial [Candidatus Acidiferrales bacterium]